MQVVNVTRGFQILIFAVLIGTYIGCVTIYDQLDYIIDRILCIRPMTKSKFDWFSRTLIGHRGCYDYEPHLLSLD